MIAISNGRQETLRLGLCGDIRYIVVDQGVDGEAPGG